MINERRDRRKSGVEFVWGEGEEGSKNVLFTLKYK
jgi:hypothetical protein